MMNAYHICSACRRQLFAKTPRDGLWRAKANFVSLSNPPTTTDDTASDNTQPFIQSDRLRIKRKSQRHGPSKSKPSNPDPLESLFEEGRSKPVPRQSVPVSVPQTTVLELYGHVETLKKLLASSNVPIEELWKFFVSHLGPDVWNSNGSPISRPLAFRSVASSLLRKLVVSRQNSGGVATAPSLTEIITTYTSLDVLADWSVLLSDLTHKLARQTQPAAQIHKSVISTDENILTASTIANSLEDLLDAWKFICECYSTPARAVHGAQDETWGDSVSLLAFSSKSVRPPPRKGGFELIILTLLPQYPQRYAKSMTCAVLDAFALLTSEPLVLGHDYKNHPFIKAIATMLVTVKTSPLDLDTLFKSRPLVSSSGDILHDWSFVLETAKEIARPSMGIEMKHSAFRPSDFKAKVGTSTMRRKLDQAVTKRNLHDVDQLWEEAKAASFVHTRDLVKGESSTAVDPISPPIAGKYSRGPTQALYNHFIEAFMGLRQSDRAIEVWNHMIETSVHPTLHTWNALLTGCKRARDMKSLDSVWRKLLASGTPPDMACWTTRISAIIECGKAELAISALDEMGRTWMQAAKRHGITELQSAGDVGGIVKPTIETINATLSGLLRRPHLIDAASRVLVWGATFGIKPDIITFNTILQALLRSGRTEQVPAVLEHMQAQGIQADVATFTTLLDEMFQTSQPQIPDERLKIVNNVLAAMSASGVHANLHTYGKIIYSLLQHETSDMSAVKAVMARMATEGFEPSTYIYTILVQRHFSQPQPDVEAVRVLIERIRLSGAPVDHIFWDRVIEGYAHIGDTASALAILGREDREGSRVGWYALEVVVRALAANGEWEFARQVVKNVRTDRGGPPDMDAKGVEGQHSFWRAVAELGLMEDGA